MAARPPARLRPYARAAGGHGNYSDNHDWGDWTPVAGSANHTRSCKRNCGATQTAAHAYNGEWIDQEDGVHHTRSCVCGATETKAHRWGDWQSLDDWPGQHVRFCLDCPAEDAEDHSFGNWTKVNDSAHRRSCVCGETQNGEHSFGN